MTKKTEKLMDAVRYKAETNTIVIIDQTKLPTKLIYKELSTLDDVWYAIRNLEVRGAPAIGVVAAYGLAMCSEQLDTNDWFYYIAQLKSANEYFRTARPTANNLTGALDAMLDVLRDNKERSVPELKALLLEEAHRQKEEDAKICRSIGEIGSALLADGDTIMTYCNAGALATSGRYGTALAPVYVATEDKKKIAVIACETRPVLQGSRLTAFELIKNNVDVTVICDNMAAAYMAQNEPAAVFVGADFVAANGDVANKIGTYGLALLAKAHHIPFYVCAPTTSINGNIKTGKDIIIEERKPEELRSLWFRSSMIPKAAKIWNPAFDVTPAELIDGIITENGLFKAPYDFSEVNNERSL